MVEGYFQQCAHQTTLAVKCLYSQFGLSPHKHCEGISSVNTVWCQAQFLLQALPVPQIFFTMQCIVVLVSTWLSGYALINASWTATKDTVWSNVWEWIHILFLNTLSSHVHTLCASDLSSSLTSRVTLARVSWGRDWENLLHRKGPATDFVFVLSYVCVVKLHFKLYTLYI
jgi:hypothetical protein